MAEEIERIYVIPLKKYGYNQAKSAPTAVKRVKDFLTRHMKVEKKNIWIDDSLNNALWSHGKFNMPSKIRVKAIKFDDGIVEAYIPELEFKKSRRELLKEERAKKEPILRKEEMGPEEEGETGSEDYDIAPSADGEVKIKKKKAPKKKKEEPEKTAVKEKHKREPKDKKENKPKTTKKKVKSKSGTKEKKETKSKTTKKKSSSKKSKK